MSYTNYQKKYDFYILDTISETSYATFKKEVLEKISSIENDKAKNKQWFISNDINPDSIPETPVEFNIHVSTFGGDCYTGLGWCDFLANLDANPNYKLKLICEGKIMSMGIPITLSVKDRVCTKNTTFMIHQLSACEWGKLEDLKDNVQELDRLQSMLDNVILTNSKITKEELTDWYSHKKDYFFNAEEAVKLGIVNSII